MRVDGRAPTDAEVDAACATLARLPAPTVAIAGPGARATPALRRLVDRFDVALESEADLARIANAVRARPLAAAALVQLLRMGETLDVPQALVAESFVYSALQAGPEFAAWRAARGAPPGLGPSSTPAVRVERFRGTLALTLDRPHKHNAFSSEMRDALALALRPARVDPGVQEIVVRGAGRSFCSGGDLDEFGTLPDPATAHLIRTTRNVARALHDLRDRVRFEVHGACIGAGCELPAFARRVVARESAFFQLPELGIGLVPGAGGTVSLPRRIGRQRTAWLALTGRRIDAPTALAWGLVDEVVLEPGVERDALA
ncbi:MAG: enoyl-CoA hydratase/isomerase family protein [Myxococcota bacterium]